MSIVGYEAEPIDFYQVNTNFFSTEFDKLRPGDQTEKETIIRTETNFILRPWMLKIKGCEKSSDTPISATFYSKPEDFQKVMSIYLRASYPQI